MKKPRLTSATREVILALILRVLLRLVKGEPAGHLQSSLEAALRELERRR
jgi:hypothetical protein